MKYESLMFSFCRAAGLFFASFLVAVALTSCSSGGDGFLDPPDAGCAGQSCCADSLSGACQSNCGCAGTSDCVGSKDCGGADSTSSDDEDAPLDSVWLAAAAAGDFLDTAAVLAREMGFCIEERQDEIRKSRHCGLTCYIICDSLSWRYASMDERDVDGFPLDTVEGAVLEGRLLSLDRSYVFEDGRWRLMTFEEKKMGVCDSLLQGRTDTLRGEYFYCDNSVWSVVSSDLYDMLMLPDSAAEGTTVRGSASGESFTYENGEWRYSTKSESLETCGSGNVGEIRGYNKVKYICAESGWRFASIEDVFGVCDESREAARRRYSDIYFVCNDGRWMADGLNSNVVNSSFHWIATADSGGKVDIGGEDPWAGRFYSVADGAFGGISGIEFPEEVYNDSNGNFYAPLVKAYEGIPVTAVLRAGYERPYVGIAFDTWSLDEKGADIRPWGGLCVVYKSDVPLVLELSSEGGVVVTAHNQYRAVLPLSQELVLMDVPFADFSQELGWGTVVDLDLVLASTATVKILFSGTAGKTGHFFVTQVGSLGTCSLAP